MSEYERLKKQKDDLVAKETITIVSCELNRIVAERDSLRKEVERLSGKTGFCLQCEGYAKQAERLREALEEIRKGGTFKWKGSENVHLEWYAKLAKEALSGRHGR